MLYNCSRGFVIRTVGLSFRMAKVTVRQMHSAGAASLLVELRRLRCVLTVSGHRRDLRACAFMQTSLGPPELAGGGRRRMETLAKQRVRAAGRREGA